MRNTPFENICNLFLFNLATAQGIQAYYNGWVQHAAKMQ